MHCRGLYWVYIPNTRVRARCNSARMKIGRSCTFHNQGIIRAKERKKKNYSKFLVQYNKKPSACSSLKIVEVEEKLLFGSSKSGAHYMLPKFIVCLANPLYVLIIVTEPCKALHEDYRALETLISLGDPDVSLGQNGRPLNGIMGVYIGYIGPATIL